MVDFIETYSGQRFSPFRPERGALRLTDIAHALSHQCRFGGHCHTFYSVAEHSVRVSKLLEAQGQGLDVQMWGLMHDASEAYIADVPTPLKRHFSFAAYRELERKVMGAICECFELRGAQPAAVGKADEILLATEARDLMAYRAEHWASLREQPLPDVIEPWSSSRARGEFIGRFVDLRASMLLGPRGAQ